MQHQLTWHGHSNFQIQSGGVNIIIDPFFEGNPVCSLGCAEITDPDLILITHDHGDHVGSTVEIAKSTGAHIAAVVGTALTFVEQGVPEEQIVNDIGFNIGGSVQFKGVTITMTQAFHSSDTGVAVGYIITLEDGYTIYHAGDTCVFGDMEIWGRLYAIDLAVLPIGGLFTMDPRQAAYACRLLKCECVTPMHWGTFPVLEKNTGAFNRYLADEAPNTRMLEMTPGETMTLERPADTCGCDADQGF